MTKRGRITRANVAAKRPRAERAETLWLRRSHDVLMACTLALMVAAALIPNSSAVSLGSHVVLVMAWFPLTVAWLLRSLAQPRPMWHIGLAGMAIAAFLILHSTSALVMSRHGHGRLTLNAMWIWLSFGLLFLTLRQFARRAIQHRAICSVMIALAMGLAALGLYQYVYAMPKMRADYAAQPEAKLVALGIDPAPDSPGRVQFENRLRSTEPIGSFALANSLAGFLVPWLVLLPGIAQSAWDRQGFSWRARVGLVLALAVLAVCLLLTKSRSAYLALVAGIGILVLSRAIPRHWLRWRRVVALVVVLAVLSPLVIKFGSLDRQIVTEASKSFLYRLQYWQATSRLIADHPWWGCGPGNFQDYYAQYKLPEASELVADPHNFLFEVAASSGLPALALFVGALAVVCVQIGRRAPPRLDGAAEKDASSELAADSGADAGSFLPVYAGLPIGLFLAFPAAWAGGLGPDGALLWGVLPLALVSLWLLHPWVTHGRLTPWPLMVAAAALLINLLAAGGIGYPGVGQIVWILAALALNVACSHPKAAPVQRRGASGRVPVAAALVIVSALSVACYFTMYRPLLGARGHLAEAREAGSRGAQERSVRAAVAADPWWAEPASFLAGMLCRQWIQAPSPERLEQFDWAVEQLQQRSPHSSSVWRRCGDWLLEMASASGRPDLAKRATGAYGRAVELYPNSNVLHAQLAWSYFLSGQPDSARNEAAMARRLDQFMPHEEQKLAKQRLVGRLRASSPPRPRGASGSRNAEQCMELIRKSSSGS